MADGKETAVGTARYFEDITKDTVFADIKKMVLINGFTDCVKAIAQNAASVLSEICDDLDRNSKTVKFLDKADIERVQKIAANLTDIARLGQASMRKNGSDIKSKLDSLLTRSGVSIYNVERLSAEIIRNNPLRRSAGDMSKLIESALRYGTSSMRDTAQKDYIEALLKKYGKDTLAAALDYIGYSKSYSNRGRNGKRIGSPEYVKEIELKVFGNFAGTSRFNSMFSTYAKGVRDQADMVAGAIIRDVGTAIRNSEYMEYSIRVKGN